MRALETLFVWEQLEGLSLNLGRARDKKAAAFGEYQVVLGKIDLEHLGDVDMGYLVRRGDFGFARELVRPRNWRRDMIRMLLRKCLVFTKTARPLSFLPSVLRGAQGAPAKPWRRKFSLASLTAAVPMTGNSDASAASAAASSLCSGASSGLGMKYFFALLGCCVLLWYVQPA